MRLKDNPFHKLGVHPGDTIGDINEAAENKSFMDEDNASLYNDARDILAFPQRRMDAEVLYVDSEESSLDGCREKLLRAVDQLYISGGMLTPQDAAGRIVEVDRLFSQSLEDSEIDALFRKINEYRREAGISPVSDRNELGEIARTQYSNNVHEMLKYLFDRYMDTGAAAIGENIALRVIRPGLGKSRKLYGDVVRAFFELYNDKIQNELGARCTKILDMIDQAEGYTEIRQLTPVFNAVKNFNLLAGPLQLYLLDIGQSQKQRESNSIAQKLKKLCIDYHNNFGRTELALAVCRFEKEEFANLPEIAASLQSVEAQLTRIASTKKLHDIIDFLNQNVIQDSSHLEQNKSIIVENKDRWLQSVRNTASQIALYKGEEKIQLIMMVALTYFCLAQACTWGGLWGLWNSILREGLPYAEKCGNQEFIDKYKGAIARSEQKREMPQAPVSHTTQPAESYTPQSSESRTVRNTAVTNQPPAAESHTFRNIAIVAAVIILLYFFFGGSGSSKPARQPSVTPRTPVSKVERDIEARKKKDVQYSKPDAGKSSVQPSVQPRTNTSSVPSESPAGAFSRFHRNISLKNFDSAWNCLTPDFQSALEYRGWVQGYRTTLGSYPENVHITYNDGNHAELTYRLRAVDNINGRKVTQYFVGSCSLVNRNGSWKIDSISARKV